MTNNVTRLSRREVSTVLPRTRGEEALAQLRQFLDNQRMSKPRGPNEFAELERKLHARVMEVEREIIGEVLEAADVDAPAVEIDGRVHRKVLRSSETYMTAAGPVRVERSLYKDRSDARNKAISAMDVRVGIVDGFWTPLAAQQAAWIVAQMTPGKAEELLHRVGNMEPSKSSLDRLPKAISAKWENGREAFEEALRTGEGIPDNAVSVAVSLDGVMAPMEGTEKATKRRATASQGRLTRGPAGYREVGCATLSFCDDKGDMISAVRIARSPEEHKATLKASLAAEVGEALRKRPDLKVVKVADGAKDNWTFLEQRLPDGPNIIDFFHGAEHLNTALAEAYGDGTVKCRARFAQLREILLDGEHGVDTVIRALTYLRNQHPTNKGLARELAYFRTHRPNMQYWKWREEGLPVGSGVVEAACKSLVAQRLKLSGMQWAAEGAQAILTMRGWDQSDRFDRAWALVAATWHADVTTVQPAPAGLRSV
jgi:hypothetical protein